MEDRLERFGNLGKTCKRIIACAFRVGDDLGVGLREVIYEMAMEHILKKEGFKVERQKKINIVVDGVVVGEGKIDLLVDERIVVELKIVELKDTDFQQCRNYLRGSNLKTCLIFNFGMEAIQVEVIKLDG